MKRFIKRVLFWLRGYRTVGPKQTPDIKDVSETAEQLRTKRKAKRAYRRHYSRDGVDK